MELKNFNQFRPFFRHLGRYFTAYGGWSSVVGSPLFILALIITAASYRAWLQYQWLDLAFTLLPSLLGFSLGTYAILFSLITNRVKAAMRSIKTRDQISMLEQVNATFFHYIIVQVLALTWAFMCNGSLIFDIATIGGEYHIAIWQAFEIIAVLGSFIGYLLMIYSVTLIVAAAMAIYRLAQIADPLEPSE